MVKFYQLWLGVMVTFFGYSEAVSSSAAIESSFYKLKNIKFKHTSLPTNIEIFLENHILSFKWSIIIALNTSTKN